jgi:RecB family exonuclease
MVRSWTQKRMLKELAKTEEISNKRKAAAVPTLPEPRDVWPIRTYDRWRSNFRLTIERERHG